MPAGLDRCFKARERARRVPFGLVRVMEVVVNENRISITSLRYFLPDGKRRQDDPREPSSEFLKPGSRVEERHRGLHPSGPSRLTQLMSANNLLIIAKPLRLCSESTNSSGESGLRCLFRKSHRVNPG